MPFISYSQNFEDVLLYRALKNIKKGFYIDIGAQDPVNHSITKAFYDLGWSGINVDPMDEYYFKLKNDRPRDINLKLAISSKEGNSSFYSFTDTGLSTMNEDYAKKHIENNFEVKKIKVKTKTLDKICIEYNITDVHFLKVDVEGSEEDVIKGFSFNNVRPWIVVIEAIDPNSKKDTSISWDSRISSHGYDFVYFDGLNRFYVAHEHAELKQYFKTPPNIFDDFVTIAESRLLNERNYLRGRIVKSKNNTIKTEAEIELEKIYTCREWKFALICRKFVKLLIPRGSIERKTLVILFRIIKLPLYFLSLTIKKVTKSVYNFTNFFIQQKINSSNKGYKKKILIDCSFVYDHPEFNTGIQRVVNNVIKNIDNNSDKSDLYILSVIKFKDYLIAVDLQKRKAFLKQKFESGFILNRIFKKIYNIIRIYFFMYNNVIVINKGDIYLMLDASWDYDFPPIMEYIRRRGGVVIGVCYDLIPVRYPQFVAIGLAEVFIKFYSNSFKYFDGFIAISKAVMGDLIEYMDSIGLESSKYCFDYFTLGSDFKKQNYILNNIRKEIVNIYNKRKSVYLTVSTIEPRKNHAYIIDSFEILWKNGVDVNLCIIGKVGWKAEDFVKRVEKHKEYNKRLFMFNDATDEELYYCYKHAKMLVFASYTEGFGLPIVESLNNSLPVLASDIPVHREVGNDAIEYFNLDDTKDLANKIEYIEKTGVFHRNTSGSIKTKTWNESTAELLNKVMKMSTKIGESENKQ